MENESVRSMHLLEEKDTYGVFVSDAAFTAVIAIAASEVEGVSLADFSSEDAQEGRSLRSFSRSMNLDFQDDGLVLFLAFNLDYGFNLPETAAALQDKLIDSVYHMLGFRLTRVNLKLSDVIIQK